MARAKRTCNTCPAIIASGSRCPTCRAQADRARGTVKERGYSGTGHRLFRQAVLTRDPVCVNPDCTEPATVADHHPRSRRQLLADGDNPDDPRHGRGLCKHHHDTATAHHQPGGWNANRGE